ncbi:MAG TPA: hypothetical protein VLS87_09050 [Woeseiaceae bacterium]|nr:hypothetical protein [Woeseiaceae bacterium]
MNKLTTMNTIKKSAPLALLAVVMSGSAFAGPNGDPGRPKGEKLSIDVENECVLNGTTLEIYTTVTPSGSKLGDGGGVIQAPSATAAFKAEVCEPNASGKKWTCTTEFQAAGSDYLMAGSQPSYSTSIDLCLENPYLSAETAVSAFISVPVKYADESTTTWTSSCDDIAKPEDFVWKDFNNNGYVDAGEMVDVVDQSNIELHFDADPCAAL